MSRPSHPPCFDYSNNTGRRVQTMQLLIMWKLQTEQITNFTEQSPSWEAKSHSSSPEVLLLFWNPKVHCYVHKTHPVNPILSQMNPVHIITLYFFKSILILSPPSMPSLLSDCHEQFLCKHGYSMSILTAVEYLVAYLYVAHNVEMSQEEDVVNSVLHMSVWLSLDFEHLQLPCESMYECVHA
jgi:hypothetical protein